MFKLYGFGFLNSTLVNLNDIELNESKVLLTYLLVKMGRWLVPAVKEVRPDHIYYASATHYKEKVDETVFWFKG